MFSANTFKNLIFVSTLIILALTLLGDYGNLFYPFGRTLIFQAMVEVLALFYFVLAFFDKEYRPNFKSPLIFAAILFWFLNLAALVFSVDRAHSFFGDPRRMTGFFTLTHLLLFFLIIAGILKSWRDWQKIFYVIILISVPASLYTIWQKFFMLDSFERAYGSLGNPNFLAAYLLFPIFLTLTFLYSNKGSNERPDLPKLLGGRASYIFLSSKFFLSAVLFLQLAAFYFAFSRGAIIAMALGTITFILLHPQWRLKLKIAGIGFLVLLGLGFLSLNINYIKTQINQPQNYYRLEIWRNALLGIKEKPIFGWGQENFQMAFDKYYSGAWEQKETMGAQTDKAHNFLLETGVTNGLLGLAGYLGVWIAAFWYLLRKYNRSDRSDQSDQSGKPNWPDGFNELVKLGILTVLVAYFVQGLFNIETLIPALHFWILIGFIEFATKSSVSKNGYFNKRSLVKIPFSATSRFIFVGIFFVLAGSIIFSLKNYHFDPLLANFYHNKARQLTIALGQEKLENIDPEIRTRYFQEAFSLYEKALKISSFIDPNIRFNWASSISIFTNFASTDEDEAKKLIENGFEFLEKNFSERSHYTRDWWLAGKLATIALEIAKDPAEKELWLQKSNLYFNKTIEISPKRPMMLTEWGQALLKAGNINAAKEKFQRAIEIKSDLPQPRWFLALTYIHEKNWLEFEKEMTLAKKLGWDIVDETGKLEMSRFSQLANTLLSQKEYRRLVELYEKVIKIEPENIQFYISLAVTYKEWGENKKARETLERVFLIDNLLREHPQIKEFLKSL